MKARVATSFFITFVGLGGLLIAGASRLSPQPHYYSNPPLTGRTNLDGGLGCNSCHIASGFSLSINGASQLYPGEAATYTAAATTTSSLNGTRFGINVDQTGGTLSVTNTAALEVSGGEIRHRQSSPSLPTVSNGAASYTFTYTMSGASSVGTGYTIAAVGAAGYQGGTAHALNKTVTAIRPADPSSLTAGTSTSASIPLSWTGSGPAYRLIGRTSAYPTGPTDTAGAVVYDVSSTSTTASGLNPATTYFFRVWGRASFSATNTFSTNPSQLTATTAPVMVTAWHVNVATGSDASNGTSAGTAFKTITKALSVYASGDAVLVYPGTYSVASGETFPLVLGGQFNLQSTAGAASTIIDASAANPRRRVFEINGAAGSVLQGLTITGGFHQPVAPDFGNALGAAIACNSADLTTISRNIIKGNESRGRQGTNTSRPGGYANGGAVHAANGTAIINNAIRDNIVRGGTGYSPISVEGGNGGNGGDAVGGGLLGGGSVYNNTFYNNLARGGDGGGTGGGGTGGLAGSGQGGGLAYSSTVINNIFSSNGAQSGVPGAGQPANGSSCCGAQAAAGTVDHNLFFGSMVNGVLANDPNRGTNAVLGDPLFLSSTDLHIRFASPARGAGTATGAPTVDLDGRTRPNPPSIGAYESKGVGVDFNGDGKPDQLLRNTTNGDVGIWLMDGLTIVSGGVAGTPGLGYRIAGAGDFDGDGKTDILLQNTASGDVGIWKMNGTSIVSGAIVGSPGTGWSAITSADLNGDGKSDIILQETSTGAIGGWLMNGFAIASAGPIGNPGTPNWQAVATGDFNSDGNTDLVIRNSSTGDIGAWILNGLTLTSGALIGSPGTSWEVSAAANLNAAGGADLVIRNTSSGDVGGWILNGTTITSGGVIASPGTSWNTRGTADFNSDGKADLVIQNSAGDIGRWQMDGLTITNGATYGTPGTAWQALWNR